MQPSFILKYFSAFHRIEGWFPFDAALMFMAYNQLLAAHGIASDVLEIGVHHGLSAIAVASLRGPGKSLYAVDLFEALQSKNISRSGDGKRLLFEQNMREFFEDSSFIHLISRASADVSPEDLGRSLSFCHVDGGHSRLEVLGDLTLCNEVLVPGGLLALDDYFNAEHPGVCEGAIQFNLQKAGALKPIAIGFNRVLFQKQPAPFNLIAEFHERFPKVEYTTVRLWEQPTAVFTKFRSYFDLQASTPQRLSPLGAQRWATVACATPIIRARPGQLARILVDLTNTCPEALPHGDRVFGLSYHLLSKEGKTISHDNSRLYLKYALAPGETIRCELPVATPLEVGEYRLELDLVWEGVMWFREIGNPTTLVELVVA